MPTKKKKTPAKKKPAPKRLSNDEYHLLTLIAATERAITPQGTSIDDLFTQQLSRLQRELEALRAKQ